ncbi:hypothetical protein GCWU000324_00927 [Kingella oralis ATCC 51147]|uniref:Uncharacterized protein n=1 Tax=Kingella oralis ATCC 51147 TaxID=629741 RepID=C4GFL1_9NEIS|nr:hypothetical protein GCWU000324_00927 [Kingella oralis ATCC 51147]
MCFRLPFYSSQCTACKQAVGGADWRFRLPKHLCSRLGSLKVWLVLCGWYLRSLNHALHASGALTFLCFAKEKEAKERRPRRAGLATPNFPYSASFFRRVRTSRTSCVVEQAHAFSRKKDASFGWT